MAAVTFANQAQSARPSEHGALLSHSIRSEGEFPKTRFIAVFDYGWCKKEYDGRNWVTVPSK